METMLVDRKIDKNINQKAMGEVLGYYNEYKAKMEWIISYLRINKTLCNTDKRFVDAYTKRFQIRCKDLGNCRDLNRILLMGILHNSLDKYRREITGIYRDLYVIKGTKV